MIALSGCDRLTISPAILDELSGSNTPVERKLTVPVKTALRRPAPMTEDEFRWQHNSDAMAVEKLAERDSGICCGSKKLEDMVAALI